MLPDNNKELVDLARGLEMNRDDIIASIEANVENQNLIKHMLATEAIMRALARHFGEDEEEWGLTGLIHDIDVEHSEEDMSRHGKLGAHLAEQLGCTETMCHAVLAHNEELGISRKTLLDKALYCADPLTGLITAGALIRPDKKLAELSVKSLKKRFKEKSFAAGANREQIALCSEIDIELEEFIGIGLEAMKGISDDLGL